MARLLVDMRRHGPLRTVGAHLLSAVRRVVDVRIARVAYSNRHVHHDTPAPYRHAWITAAEFAALPPTADRTHADRSAAFARGDECVATLCGDAVVGYNFYSRHADRVNATTEFEFPADEFVYSYDAYTWPEHRGRGLSPARWAYVIQTAPWGRTPTIMHVDLDNLSSLDSGAPQDRIIIGYTAWLKVGRSVWHWRSPGCRARRTGFRRAPPDDSDA